MMEFKKGHLKAEFNGQQVGIPCMMLGEPDADSNVWIHLDQAPPLVADHCLQFVSTSQLIGF